jgi:hypothetical protein
MAEAFCEKVRDAVNMYRAVMQWAAVGEYYAEAAACVRCGGARNQRWYMHVNSKLRDLGMLAGSRKRTGDPYLHTCDKM